RKTAITISGKRSILIAEDRLYFGIVNEAIPVKATTMTTGAETIPADTADSPRTNAPTILTADPICLGSRNSVSRSATKVISIINTSMNTGQGTSSRAVIIFNYNEVGIIS